MLVLTNQIKLDQYLDQADASIVPSQAELKSMAKKMALNGHMKKVSLDQTAVICRGDIAQIRTESELPKFNRERVSLTVGNGLYSRELEEQLIGRTVGARFTTMIQGKNVNVEILSANRMIEPELTDDMIVSLGLAGVSTFEQLTEHVESMITVSSLGRYVNRDLIPQMMADATFDGLTAADIDWAKAQKARSLQALMESVYEKPYASCTPDETAVYLDGCEDMDAYLKKHENDCVEWLKKCVLLSTVQGEDFWKKYGNTADDDVELSLIIQLSALVKSELKKRRA